MDSLWASLSLGIIAGLLATFLSAVIYQIWLRIIQPWYQELLYQGAHIEGRWQTLTTINDKEREGILELKRIGHSIEGTVTNTDEERNFDRYNIVGTFRNLILTATYDSVDETIISRGGLTLMLSENGHLLKGWLSYYSWQSKGILTEKFTCKRIR